VLDVPSTTKEPTVRNLNGRCRANKYLISDTGQAGATT
jgi:hypothetical protein